MFSDQLGKHLLKSITKEPGIISINVYAANFEMTIEMIG